MFMKVGDLQSTAGGTFMRLFGKNLFDSLDKLLQMSLDDITKKEKFKERIDGIDPGAPNNPKMGKKFLITTIITSIIFSVIYYLVKFNLLIFSLSSSESFQFFSFLENNIDHCLRLDA